MIEVLTIEPHESKKSMTTLEILKRSREAHIREELRKKYLLDKRSALARAEEIGFQKGIELVRLTQNLLDEDFEIAKFQGSLVFLNRRLNSLSKMSNCPSR